MFFFSTCCFMNVPFFPLFPSLLYLYFLSVCSVSLKAYFNVELAFMCAHLFFFLVRIEVSWIPRSFFFSFVSIVLLIEKCFELKQPGYFHHSMFCVCSKKSIPTTGREIYTQRVGEVSLCV